MAGRSHRPCRLIAATPTPSPHPHRYPAATATADARVIALAVPVSATQGTLTIVRALGSPALARAICSAAIAVTEPARRS